MAHTVSYSAQEIPELKGLFPSEMEDDCWVLYHATTSQFEEMIDNRGLAGGSQLVDQRHVTELVRLYRRMNWGGIAGGFSTLATFTFGRSGSYSPQTWFRATSMRSLVYATRTFSGGEAMMSFRFAFSHLLEYLCSEDLRNQHLQEQVRGFVNPTDYRKRPPVLIVDLPLLERELEHLRPFYQACEEYAASYRYGLVYAMRFTEGDVANLFDKGGNGILYRGKLPPGRLVGKAILDFTGLTDLEADECVFKCSGRQLDRVLQSHKSPLLKAIEKKQEPTLPMFYQDVEPGTWLGEDISSRFAALLSDYESQNRG